MFESAHVHAIAGQKNRVSQGSAVDGDQSDNQHEYLSHLSVRGCYVKLSMI